MSFLAPGAFFLGLLLPVIVALYLLKLRRTEREVPSTFLWRRMVRDVEANAPWQKLRPNLLMILQLLFLLALIFALARPFTWSNGVGGQAAIIILDTSASMAATDVAPSRIESAKERARQLVDDLPDNARVTVIDAGREARVLLSSSVDRRQAHLAIQGVQAGTGGSDLGVALELASAIASRQPGTEIIVLSDGRVELPERLSVKGALRYIPFGLDGENQAISLLTIDRGNTAFVQVTNYGKAQASRRLSLFADGLLVNAYDLTDIPPGGQRSVIAENLPEGTQMIEARLDGSDTLALDDDARAIRPQSRPVPVTLVGPGNKFIRTALSLLPGVILTEQIVGEPPVSEPTPVGALPTATPEPTATPPTTVVPSTPALVIYDSYIPEQIPPGGSLLFIAPPASSPYFTVTGQVEAPVPRAVDPSDPLLANVSLSDVAVRDSVQVPLPEWATPVISGELQDAAGNGPGNVPLLFRGEVDGRRVAVVAFDLRHSDLPLQIAFPLLWANLVDWLVPGAGSAVPDQVAPGETLSFPVPEGAETAVVTRPDGEHITLQPDAGRFVFTDTTGLGEYTISFRPAETASLQTAAFTVNLFSPLESDLLPAGSLPGVETQAGADGQANRQAQREWWRPLALLALGLLVGEWLVYQRAALVKIKDLVRAAVNMQKGGKRA
jgi:Ca-activated chloride channel homolog